MGITRHLRRGQTLFLLVAVLLLIPTESFSQQRVGIPTIAAADQLLDSGVNQFSLGNYDESLVLFERVYGEFEVNASTTAARIMAAKSAYRSGLFRRSRSILAGFATDFPTSGYLDEARRLDEMALIATRMASATAFKLGVLLSLSEEDRGSSQSLFNGIRLAVDEHNAGSGSRAVIMVYRDITGPEDATSQAVRELSAVGVSMIIGTLYSEEAVAAANQAEQERLVFIAPLATDERVSDSRTYSFQANPSMSVRGELMARFAINGLRISRLGVIATADERKVSERLSDGFVQEASRLGAEINFINILPDESSWFGLPDELPSDTLSSVDALYVPLATRDPIPLAGSILSAMDRMGNRPRLLGNAAWHDLPQKTHASKYTTTYANDFFLDDSSPMFKQFAGKYEDLAGEDVDRLGITGYDVTTFALRALSKEDSRELFDVVRNMPAFEGLALRIGFEGGNVNRFLFYHRYRDGTLSLIR